MNDTPTPRTDAQPAGFNGYPSTISRDFARTLELELAALRKHIDRCSDSLDKWIKQAQFWEGRAAILRHENNKLRRKLYPNK